MNGFVYIEHAISLTCAFILQFVSLFVASFGPGVAAPLPFTSRGWGVPPAEAPARYERRNIQNILKMQPTMIRISETLARIK